MVEPLSLDSYAVVSHLVIDKIAYAIRGYGVKRTQLDLYVAS